VAASPGEPSGGGAGQGRMGEQPGGLGDGQRSHSRIGGQGLVWPDRGGCPCAGAAEQGGCDGAYGQGGHDQHSVPGDRGMQPDLGLIEPEAAFPGSEILFNRPAAPGRADQPGQRRRLAGGDETVVKGQLAGGQVAADEQVATRGGGAQPGPASSRYVWADRSSARRRTCPPAATAPPARNRAAAVQAAQLVSAGPGRRLS
jgi:hypothetical protein